MLAAPDQRQRMATYGPLAVRQLSATAAAKAAVHEIGARMAANGRQSPLASIMKTMVLLRDAGSYPANNAARTPLEAIASLMWEPPFGNPFGRRSVVGSYIRYGYMSSRRHFGQADHWNRSAIDSFRVPQRHSPTDCMGSRSNLLLGTHAPPNFDDACRVKRKRRLSVRMTHRQNSTSIAWDHGLQMAI
jgi:hypothetical protein